MSRRRPERLRRAVDRFLSGIEAVPFAAAAARACGPWRPCSGEGHRSALADAMSAGHAVALGAVLVTPSTRHFRRVKDLQLSDWTVSPGPPAGP